MRNSGCSRILNRLRQGPASSRELYGTCYAIIHSRVSELRKRGYAITCERSGDTWTYSLGGSLPPAVTPNPLAPEVNGFTLSGEEYAERRPEERVRIYRLCQGQLDLVATATLEDALPTVATLKHEGEFNRCAVGILDTAPEYEEGTGEWLVNPYESGR